MKSFITQLYRPTLLTLFMLMLGSCCPQHFVPSADPPPLQPFYLPEKINVALVLGSGGIRGMAHLGVIEELENAGIPIDLIVGCSAGSIVGALYADNPHAAEIKHTVWRIHTDTLLDFDLLNCRYGLSQGRTMQKILQSHLYATTFEQLEIPLVVVASDLYSGELVPFGAGNLVRAVQASCAIPLLFVPCDHMGRILIDGGVINPVPVNVAKDLGANIIIAVDLCELLPKTFPTNFFQIAQRSGEIAYLWHNEACTHFADVVIRPRTCGIGTFNNRMKKEIYEAGKQAAREQIPKIKELIAKISEEDRNNRALRVFTPHCYIPQICKEHSSIPEIMNGEIGGVIDSDSDLDEGF